MKMTVREATSITEDCCFLLIEWGYDNILDDSIDMFPDNAAYREHWIKHFPSIIDWLKNVNKHTNFFKFQGLFTSAPKDIQLGCLKYLEVIVLKPLLQCDPNETVEFEIRLPAVLKLVTSPNFTIQTTKE